MRAAIGYLEGAPDPEKLGFQLSDLKKYFMRWMAYQNDPFLEKRSSFIFLTKKRWFLVGFNELGHKVQQREYRPACFVLFNFKFIYE